MLIGESHSTYFYYTISTYKISKRLSCIIVGRILDVMKDSISLTWAWLIHMKIYIIGDYLSLELGSKVLSNQPIHKFGHTRQRPSLTAGS